MGDPGGRRGWIINLHTRQKLISRVDSIPRRGYAEAVGGRLEERVVHRWDSSKEKGVDACAVNEFCRLQEWYGMG